MPQARACLRGRICAWGAAFALAAAMALPASALAVPASFWGVVPQSTPSAEQFQRLKRGGVDSVRVPIAWNVIQPSPGVAADWSGTDALIAAATQAGIEVLPFVSGAPTWVVPAAPVPGSGGAARAPKTLPVRSATQRAAWSSFVASVVARYGPNGSFWAENPAIPARPIRTWQIWNEQNFKYFVVRPNPAEYGRLLKLSFTAIRGVDPAAKLLLGGMFSEPREATFKVRPRQAYFASDFLDRLYETTPGIKSKFAGIALHPYTGRYQELVPDIEEFRAVLKRNRDAGKELWVTEVSWSSQPPAANNSFAKGPRGQVKQLKGAFRLFERWQAKWRLKRVYWFSIEDAPPGVCNFCDGSGLFGPGFVAKPAWSAYVRFADGRVG